MFGAVEVDIMQTEETATVEIQTVQYEDASVEVETVQDEENSATVEIQTVQTEEILEQPRCTLKKLIKLKLLSSFRRWYHRVQ